MQGKQSQSLFTAAIGHVHLLGQSRCNRGTLRLVLRGLVLSATQSSVCMLKSQPMGTGELSVTIQRLLSSSLASPPAGIGLHSALMSGDVNSGHNEH